MKGEKQRNIAAHVTRPKDCGKWPTPLLAKGDTRPKYTALDPSTSEQALAMFHPFAPPTDDFDNLESNKARPLTDAILTVRVIKSFEYRSMKALVLKDCDLTVLTVGELKERCKKGEGVVATRPKTTYCLHRSIRNVPDFRKE